ncbi:hypothetical protein [Lysinibacillus xylanilyticus]|uniref:hypothetical protein n=1 Tax=Lysinibacillus xylanilyticus TaxID=582475 RepID=UPI003D03C20F
MSSCYNRFRCTEVPQDTHCHQTPIHCPSNPPVPSPNHECSKESKCNFKKSQLFCTSHNDDLFFTIINENDTQLQLRNTVATLKVCQEDCSSILHDICGVIHTTFTPSSSTFFKFSILFSIIDEFGREICEHTVGSSIIVQSSTEVTTLNFPFCIKCCDRPHSCDSKMTYRLQAKLLDAFGGASGAFVIRDVAWSAIVWENC